MNAPRLALILGGVAVFTGGSALRFRCRSLKARYNLDNAPAAEGNA